MKFFLEQIFIKQILFCQTWFACLMHLSQILSNNLYFITTLSAKHKNRVSFEHFWHLIFCKSPLPFPPPLKEKKIKQIKTVHFSKWKINHQVMSYDTDSEFEADSIQNISLKPNKRSSCLNSLRILLKQPLPRLILIQLIVYPGGIFYHLKRSTRSTTQTLLDPAFWIVEWMNYY